VLAVVFGVIMYRVIILSILFVAQDEIVNKFAKIVTSITAAVISLIAILILNRVSITTALYMQCYTIYIYILKIFYAVIAEHT